MKILLVAKRLLFPFLKTLPQLYCHYLTISGALWENTTNDRECVSACSDQQWSKSYWSVVKLIWISMSILLRSVYQSISLGYANITQKKSLIYNLTIRGQQKTGFLFEALKVPSIVKEFFSCHWCLWLAH